jgi:hypothetical protein
VSKVSASSKLREIIVIHKESCKIVEFLALSADRRPISLEGHGKRSRVVLHDASGHTVLQQAEDGLSISGLFLSEEA